ncbi:MAG: hypothetical protein MZV70_72815 [Desulfobacterales bacterium]|nr:hypothetical protein [Desulfobacterales bacterium]
MIYGAGKRIQRLHDRAGLRRPGELRAEEQPAQGPARPWSPAKTCRR